MFERFALVDGRWAAGRPNEPISEPLVVAIHDSDIAVVQFASEDGARGSFYLGYEPRIYFDDPNGSTPVDRPAVAVAFSRWARAELGVEVSPAAVEGLMASNHADDEWGP